MRRAWFVLGSTLALASCGGGGGSGNNGGAGAAVDCEWFAQDNCWKTAVDEANACVDETLTGSVSADARTCSYADGTSIVFASPLSEQDGDNYVWDFSASRQGQRCASFKELGPTGEGGFLLSTASGEVREEVAGLNIVFSCPDGERARMDFTTAFTCLDVLPGIAWSGSGTGGISASFSFLGGADSEQLFSCSSP